MSTDAFFFFHMDPENKRGESSTQQYHHQPTASTSSSSVVSRQQFLVEYSPKPTRVAPVPQTLPAAPVTSTQHQAIHKWLANHRSYSYLPHDDDSLEHSAFSDDEEEEEEEDSYSSTSSESSDSEEDDDQIYMAPRRQHSAPLISSSAILPPVATAPVPAAAVPRRAWPLSAARPAMPVVDRAEATAFTTLQDKSHWSDDEDDEEEEDLFEEEVAEEWIDEDDLPALDADSGAPASTSTRSLPIPIFAPPRTRSNPILSSRKSRLDWDASSPRAARKMIQDGQSFWTPWISDYIAAQNN